MAKQVPIVYTTPGSWGLNTEQSAADIGPQWATDATNCRIDRSGRLACKPGWADVTTSAVESGAALESIGLHYSDVGVSTPVMGINEKLYKGTTTLTDITGAITTPTASRWQFVNHLGNVYGIQDGHTPIKWTGTGNFANLTVAVDGTIPNGPCGLAAFNRLWIVKSNSDHTVLRFSDLGSDNIWDDATAPGASGSIDMNAYWVRPDVIKAVAAYGEYLVVFGLQHVTIFDAVFGTLAMMDQIEGVGCIARDSVQVMGNDIWFLSQEGVRTLGRLTQQDGTLPLRFPTAHVSGLMREHVVGEDDTIITSVYDPREGYYLLTMPTSAITWCFDTKFPLQGGYARATVWDSPTPIGWVYDVVADEVYLSSAGKIAKMTGETDNGTDITAEYNSPWLFATTAGTGQDRVGGTPFFDASRLKTFKYANVVMEDSSGITVTFEWAVDYIDTASTAQLTTASQNVSEYNVALWDVDEFYGTGGVSVLRFPMTKTGDVFKIGLTFTNNGNSPAIQRIEIVKTAGKI